MALMATCGCGIDVHAHVVPETLPRCLRERVPADWPAMEPAHACHRHVVVSGRVYRTVSDRCWDGAKRLADMDVMGIDVQALSPMPELLSTWMDPLPASDLIRFVNDMIAELVAGGRGRFVGLGAVPLQDVEAAIVELRRCRIELGFAGVEIGSNVNGLPIGAPDFLPFFAAAEELGAAVFVHALRPTGMDRLVGPAQLQQVLAYPTDIGLAAASVITANLVVRHPRLRIGFSHGGGTLAALLPRLEEGCRVFPALAETLEMAPGEQARRLFYDALVYDAPMLRHLVGLFGDGQVMAGTDYPFAFHERQPVRRVEEAFPGDATRERLLRRNAERFLGLTRSAA